MGEIWGDTFEQGCNISVIWMYYEWCKMGVITVQYGCINGCNFGGTWV